MYQIIPWKFITVNSTLINMLTYCITIYIHHCLICTDNIWIWDCSLFRPHLISKDLIFTTLGLHYILFVALFFSYRCFCIFEIDARPVRWSHSFNNFYIFPFQVVMKNGGTVSQIRKHALWRKAEQVTVRRPVFLWTTNPTNFWVMERCRDSTKKGKRTCTSFLSSRFLLI